MTRCNDLLRRTPTKWRYITGNRWLKNYLRTLLASIRASASGTGTLPTHLLAPLLVFGNSRSGKTSTINLFLRCLRCQKLDDDLDPCDGSCSGCANLSDVYPVTGLFAEVENPGAALQVYTHRINCNEIRSREQLLDQILEVKQHFGCLRVGFLDEAQRFANGAYGEALLKALEDDSVLWITATIDPTELNQPFVNRHIPIQTEPPAPEELEDRLADLCKEFRIPFEDDAILRVVTRSRSIPGIAMQPLALAAMNEDGLTLDLVENYWNPPP